ncbi:MAG: DUF2997 domain-containing protein [Chloroflexota bacterium]|nr:MAG: hypothetical protein DLM70_03415 [Chloroflexota bacterium]
MMAEVEFTIDSATGELTMHVKGISGPGCTDIAKIASDLLGTPAHDWQTPEYYLRPQVRSQVRGKRTQ